MWRVRIRTLKDSLQHICSHPISTFFVWLLIGIALSLPPGLWLVQHNLHLVSESMGDDTGITVYFVLGVDSQSIDATARSIEGENLVLEVEVTTAEQALEYFKATSGFADQLSALEINPLPASLSLTIKQDADREQIKRLASRLQGRGVVHDVVVDTQWMAQVGRIQNVALRLVWLYGVLFGVGVTFVSVAAVRYAISTKLDELRVIALLGASDRYLRRPFVYCGMLYGLGGGIVAFGITVLALQVIRVPLQDLTSSYGGQVEVVALNFAMGGALAAIGTLLGLVGALHVTFVQTRRDRYLDQVE